MNGPTRWRAGGLVVALATAVQASAAPPPPPGAAGGAAKEQPGGGTTASDKPTGDSSGAVQPDAAKIDAPDDAARRSRKVTTVPGSLVQVTATLTVKVVHPDEVRKAAVARVVAAGGYAKLVTDTELHLEVPQDKLQETLDALSAAGIVLHKGLQRLDRTQEIAQLDARLRSKREILERLRSFFDDADVQSTLRIENAMTQLVHEIESLQGQFQAAVHETWKAHVHVSFQFHPRQVITDVRSPFAWLNSLDIQRFLSDFER